VTGAPLRLGTRKSPMALVQSRLVAELILDLTGRQAELVGVATLGDMSQSQLTQIGGTGVFVSGLRRSLLAGEVDIAVHSLKDLPTQAPAGIVLAAVPVREDPRDALAAAGGAKLADLPSGARIGTGSPRRAAQLLMMRPDIRPVPIRGNAGTRLAKVASGEVAAVVLAYSGLARIGRLDAVSQIFEPDEMLPAPGQGALAVECAAARPDLAELLARLDDAPSRAATTAERALLAALQAGCTAPIGAYAAGTDGLRLQAVVAAPDGGGALRASAVGPMTEAERLGRRCAADLLARGAGDYVAVSGGHISNGDDAQ
jgi:hydroxymethylbilane synthase